MTGTHLITRIEPAAGAYQDGFGHPSHTRQGQEERHRRHTNQRRGAPTHAGVGLWVERTASRYHPGVRDPDPAPLNISSARARSATMGAAFALRYRRALCVVSRLPGGLYITSPQGEGCDDSGLPDERPIYM